MNCITFLSTRIFSTVVLSLLFFIPVLAQESEPKDSPIIVQPGAPGQATKVLPSTTTAKLPPSSPQDIAFMQGMIMHHAQAVEMTALIEERTDNKGVRGLGARISHTQTEEINFMKRWLMTRNQKTTMSMPKMSMEKMDGMADHKHKDHSLMPGMLTKKQMTDLAKAKGKKFDELFLKGMIQHHDGALIMVNELFAAPGAGQDAELFNFATDVDSSQRAEIRIMQNMLDESPKEEK